MTLYPDYSSIKSYQDWKDEWYSQNCWDHNYEFVYKKGESGRITLYQQCNSCGKKHHKGVFKHSAVDNLHEKMFVQNPSCENVEVRKRYSEFTVEPFVGYKIIIPQEIINL